MLLLQVVVVVVVVLAYDNSGNVGTVNLVRCFDIIVPVPRN